MKKILLLFLILCLFLMTACHKSLNAGTVIDKKFSPAHKTYNPMILHIGKQTQIIPRWITHSDSWAIWVQDGEDKDCWEVSKEYYKSVQIGDHVERIVN